MFLKCFVCFKLKAFVALLPYDLAVVSGAIISSSIENSTNKFGSTAGSIIFVHLSPGTSIICCSLHKYQ